MSRRAKLAPVADHDTGELATFTPEAAAVEIQQLRDEVNGLQRALKAEIRRHEETKRDRQREAEGHRRWPTAVRLFHHWQDACRHPRAEWTWERFEMVLPYLTRRRYGLEMCVQAVAGAAFDPWTKLRKNGTRYRHDSWDTIFGQPGAFEDFVNKAPRPWKPDLRLLAFLADGQEGIEDA